MKPLPGRRATATCRPRADGGTEIVVVVDGPSADPDENKEGVRAQMVVEVIRHKSSDGISQEETAKDSGGSPAICSTWSTKEFDSSARGLMRRLPGGCSWTCLFVLHGPLEDNGWSHSVVVRETREIKRAHIKSDESESTNSAGPNFVARMWLTAMA